VVASRCYRLDCLSHRRRANRKGNPCRAPAMPNGRCRMHRGKSTGPSQPRGVETDAAGHDETRIILGSNATVDACDPGIAAWRAAGAGRQVKSAQPNGRVWPKGEWRLWAAGMPEQTFTSRCLMAALDPERSYSRGLSQRERSAAPIGWSDWASRRAGDALAVLASQSLYPHPAPAKRTTAAAN
jgi:hypothetical protein